MISPREEARAAGSVIAWAVLIVLIGALVTAVGWYTKPFWLGLERKAYTASHQYVEARKTAISNYAAEYRGAGCPDASSSRVQCTAIADRIRAEVDKLPSDVPTPRSATKILEEN